MEQMLEQCRGMMGMMGDGMMGTMMANMMLPMWLGAFLGLVLIAVGILLLARWLRGWTHSEAGAALTILQERLARGEIGIEEYQERRRVL